MNSLRNDVDDMRLLMCLLHISKLQWLAPDILHYIGTLNNINKQIFLWYRYDRCNHSATAWNITRIQIICFQMHIPICTFFPTRYFRSYSFLCLNRNSNHANFMNEKKKYKISAFWMKRILSYNFVAPNRNFYQNEKLFFLPISKSNAFVPKTRNSNSNIHWRMLSFGTSAYFYVLMMCRAIDRNFFFVCDILLCEWYVVTNYRQWHKHRHAMYDVRVSKRRRHH